MRSFNYLPFFTILLISACSSIDNDKKSHMSIDTTQNRTGYSEPRKPVSRKTLPTIEHQFPGPWLISSSFPDENSYNALRDMYIDGLFGEESGDYLHARKSHQYIKDHKFLFCFQNDAGDWKYFVVNTKNKRIQSVSPDSIAAPPDISWLTHKE